MLWNSVDTGPKRDLLGDLTESVRKAGLKMGFYYSLYEWFNPLWRLDKSRYVAEHMAPQFMDVVMRYKPSIIFSDGEWDLPDTQWKSPELLTWLFNDSPCKDEVVINDRWGKDIRHKHGGYYTTEYGAGLTDSTHPWEENRGIGFSFGYNRNEPLSNYRTTEELILMLVDLVSRGGNLLLDVGPTADGRIPMIMQSRLIEMGEWLAVNGEAIYATRPWSQNCQWSAGTKPTQDDGRHKYNVMDIVRKKKDGTAHIQAFFTSKTETLYAITPGWPGTELLLRDVTPKDNAKITMLGSDATLPWRVSGKDLAINLSNITPDKLPCHWAYTFKIPAKPPTKPKPETKKPEKKEDPEDQLERVILESLKDIFK
jgi:alpha-L-fucosidase